MKVLILAHGSRGDVQPFVALASQLKAHGHSAVLAAPQCFAPLAQAHGVYHEPIFDVRSVSAASSSIRSTSNGAHSGLSHLAAVMRTGTPLMRRVLDDVAQLAGIDADIVVHHLNVPGHEIAERLGVPSVPVLLQPIVIPTKEFRDPLIPFRLPRCLNSLSYIASNAILRLYAGNITEWRTKSLKLPPRRGHRNPMRQPDGRPSTVLQAFSLNILPGFPHYPPWVRSTGFWFPPNDEDWMPPRGLSDFLSAGDPPVYVGFGSRDAIDPDPRQTANLITNAIRLAGVRAVVLADSEALPIAESPDVFYLRRAPHDWLFPRMSAIVHHGGVGTVAAALVSRRPQVVCPFALDQPFFAHCMHIAGVAPSPKPRHHLTPEVLAGGIREAVSNQKMIDRAAEIGNEVRTEPGTEAAIEVIESLI